MASFLEFCSSCCTEYKVYRGHRQWLFFKHFLGSNRANLKAFVRRTGRLGKEKEAESYISDFFLQIINGCLTPPPSPLSPFVVAQSGSIMRLSKLSVFVDEKSQVSFPQLSRKLWPQDRRAESCCFVVFISQNRVSSSSRR